jgi:hypothetical protein
MKRLSLAGVGLVLLLAATRAWWGWEAERRMRRMLDPVIARGEPVGMADLNKHTIPDEANAAVYFKMAARVVRKAPPSADPPASSSVTFPDYPPYGATWDRMAAAAVAANPEAFRLMRKGRTVDRFNWGTRFTTPGIAVLLPHLNDARHLANLISDSALHAHFSGDDAAALETLADLRHQARSLYTEPIVVSHHVAIGIDMISLHGLQVMAPALRIGPDGIPPPPAFGDSTRGVDLVPTSPSHPPRPASPSQVRALIAELLDERDTVAGLKGALGGERALQVDMAEWMGRAAPTLRPMYLLDAVRMLHVDEAVMEAAAQPNWPAAKAVIDRAIARKAVPPPPTPQANMFGTVAITQREPNDHPRLLSSNLIGGLSVSRAIERNMQLRAERRMAAVSLAAQLYRADHGTWPPTLEALVPKYLPQVPRDPLAANGAALGYLLVPRALPDGADRPVVYSVGRDGKNETPDASVLPKTPSFGVQRGRDEWRDLSRWVPATAPSTQPR